MSRKVSIIMGIYNCEATLSEAIDSILIQTYSNWELIMCDDGSKDNTYQIAEQYKMRYPQKIILIKNECNKGLNLTLNHCWKYATGDYDDGALSFLKKGAGKYDESLNYKKAFLRAYYEISRLRRIERDFGSETESENYKFVQWDFEDRLSFDEDKKFRKYLTDAESEKGFERATKALDEM